MNSSADRVYFTLWHICKNRCNFASLDAFVSPCAAEVRTQKLWGLIWRLCVRHHHGECSVSWPTVVFVVWYFNFIAIKWVSKLIKSWRVNSVPIVCKKGLLPVLKCFWSILIPIWSFFGSVRSSNSHPDLLVTQHHPTFSDHTGPQQTWNLSKNLHDPIFGRKNFTHWKRLNWDYFRHQ